MMQFIRDFRDFRAMRKRDRAVDEIMAAIMPDIDRMLKEGKSKPEIDLFVRTRVNRQLKEYGLEFKESGFMNV